MHSFFRRYPALWVAFVFATGIALGFYFIFAFNARALFAAFLICVVLLIFSYRFLPSLFLPLAAVAVFIGGMNYGFQHFTYYPPQHLLNFNPKQIQAIRGFIANAEYRLNGKHRYLVQTEQAMVDSQWFPVTGKLILFTKQGLPKFQYGKRMQISAPLELPTLPSNPGQFNYRKYLNLKGIFYQAYGTKKTIQTLAGKKGSFMQADILEPIRIKIRRIINRYVRPPTRDVLKALILGERQDLDRGIYSEFQKTGVVHVLAISGLHVGFILLIFLTFFALFPISYKKRYLYSFVLLALFVALVNFKAPVVRASLMAVLYFGLQLGERRPSPLNVLAVAGLIILLFDPSQLLQPGFQFSFAAVGGILYGYPHLKQMMSWKPGRNRLTQAFNRWIVQPLLVSLAAVLGTLPLTWWYYGSLQIGALIINLFIIPLIGLLVIGGFLFAIVGIIGLPVLDGFAFLLEQLTGFILKLVHFFSQFNWVQMNVAHPSRTIFLLTIVLIFLAFQMYKREVRIYAAGILLLLIVFLLPKKSATTRITFLDVGQGDACLLQFPRDVNVLVDAGDHNRWRDYGKRVVVPLLHYRGIHHLRYAVATHPHSDHYGGFSTVMRSVTVDTFVVSPYPDSSKSYLRLLALAKFKNIPILYKRRGQTLNFGKQVRAYVLSPVACFEKVKLHNGREINNSSVVLKVCYGRTNFLLTGDAQKDAEKVMLSYGKFLKSTILKVGHHGSVTSSSTEFLRQIQPEFGVISVGRKNKFHHPSSKTLNNLAAFHIPALRTDRLGALVFESDGHIVRLINWRK